jgi:DNA-binding transcriptional MerR regulator
MNDPLLTLREYARLAPWNVRDLTALAGGILAASGITPTNAAAQSRPSDRTIRFYVTRNLMGPPEGRGTAAIYSYRHLLQLLAIKLRQMEGATLRAIAKELADATGDVLEKRVAAQLGFIPEPEDVEFAGPAPRGRVARAIAARRANPSASTAQDASGEGVRPLEAGAWYRVGIGEGAEVALRHDHPAAGSALQRQRVAQALARALRDSTGTSDTADTG